MVNPACPGFITLQDLVKRYIISIILMISHYYYYSGQGETVVSMLTDLNGFLTYENREFSLAEGSEGTFV